MFHLIELLYEASIPAISLVQKSFVQQQDIMFALSNIFDPRYAFLIYAPLLFAFDRHTGKKMMWATCIAEWSNHVLKWLMHGERPYWWVHEYSQAKMSLGYNSTLPQIRQTFMTCETGPGSPSGHAMVTATVWYVIITGLLRHYNTPMQNASKPMASLISKFCWSAYTIALFAVSLSRIYIAAHFPHQCLLGMTIGVAVAMVINAIDTDSVSRSGYIFGTIGMIGSATITYVVLLSMGFNPLWSVERALKWCGKREYVHIDTTPFFSMMRYSGFFLGMGLGLHSKLYAQASRTEFTRGMQFATALLSLLASKGIEHFPMPKGVPNMQLYAIVFCLNVALPYLFIAVIPYLVNRLRQSIVTEEEQKKSQ